MALLPGGVVIFGIQYAHIPIPSTSGSPVLIGLFLWGLWATIALAGSIDPELSSKIAMLKDVISIWSSSGADKKQ